MGKPTKSKLDPELQTLLDRPVVFDRKRADLEYARETRRRELTTTTEAFAMTMSGPGQRVTKSKIREALELATYMFQQIDAQLDEEFDELNED